MTTIAEKLFAAANLANEQNAMRAAAEAERFATRVMSFCESVAASGKMYCTFGPQATSLHAATHLGVSIETDLFMLIRHPRCMATLRENKFRLRQEGRIIYVSWNQNDPLADELRAVSAKALADKVKQVDVQALTIVPHLVKMCNAAAALDGSYQLYVYRHAVNLQQAAELGLSKNPDADLHEILSRTACKLKLREHGLRLHAVCQNRICISWDPNDERDDL